MTRLGPGRCSVCSAEVWWHGKSWHNPRSSARHRCPVDRPVCGAWMPQARERCVRRGGHAFEHRSAYALDNARVARGSLRHAGALQ